MLLGRPGHNTSWGGQSGVFACAHHVASGRGNGVAKDEEDVVGNILIIINNPPVRSKAGCFYSVQLPNCPGFSNSTTSRLVESVGDDSFLHMWYSIPKNLKKYTLYSQAYVKPWTLKGKKKTSDGTYCVEIHIRFVASTN